jgi:hypothetical protein
MNLNGHSTDCRAIQSARITFNRLITNKIVCLVENARENKIGGIPPSVSVNLFHMSIIIGRVWSKVDLVRNRLRLMGRERV